MKKIFLVGILLTALIFSGCSSNNQKDVLTVENMKYSNIDDEATQDKVYKFLEKNNIDKHDVDMFMNSVKSYYKSVEGVKLINENEKLSDMQVSYNEYELSSKWDASNPDFTDQNCRITAFRLFNKFIISNSNLSYEDIDQTNLEFDVATLRDNPNAKFSQEDMNKFFNFYSQIKVSDMKNEKKCAEEIANEWEKREISFKPDESVSLISGFIPYEEENALFVGHTGVAINTKDGVAFIEKYGFGLPYQITLFKDKEELKLYMLDRLQTSFTGESQSYVPVIMENDKLM